MAAALGPVDDEEDPPGLLVRLDGVGRQVVTWGLPGSGFGASASAAPGLDGLVVASREEMVATLGVLE